MSNRMDRRTFFTGTLGAGTLLGSALQSARGASTQGTTSGPVVTVDDWHVTWPALLADLQGTVDWCDRKLAEYEPYEVRSRGA